MISELLSRTIRLKFGRYRRYAVVGMTPTHRINKLCSCRKQPVGAFRCCACLRVLVTVKRTLGGDLCDVLELMSSGRGGGDEVT